MAKSKSELEIEPKASSGASYSKTGSRVAITGQKVELSGDASSLGYIAPHSSGSEGDWTATGTEAAGVKQGGANTLPSALNGEEVSTKEVPQRK
jgi:hypothetical protein